MSAAALQRSTSAAAPAAAAQCPCRRRSSSVPAAAKAAPRQRRPALAAAAVSASAAPRQRRPAVAAAATKDDQAKAPPAVKYGADWYAATREASKPSTVREELARRRAVNDVAYRDRRLNSDAWEGSEYRGSPVNILTLLVALFLLVPVLGLAFAYKTYGVLWG